MSKDTQFEGLRFYISAAPCNQPVDCKQTGLVIGWDMEHGQWVRSSDYDRLAAALQSSKDEAERARGEAQEYANRLHEWSQKPGFATTAQLESIQSYCARLEKENEALAALTAENAALREALSYERLKTELKGVQDDAEEMGSSDIPDGYEELSPEHLTIADACWRHGKECMETAVLNRLYDYSKAALHPATKEGKAE